MDAAPMLRSFAHQREYARRLVADLSQEDMIDQPVPGVVMNHPAWVLSHVMVYTDLIGRMLRGEPAEDPAEHPHGRQSTPLSDPRAYLPRDELVARFLEVHDATAASGEAAAPGVWEQPVSIERWSARWSRLAEAAQHILVHHEAMHLGQLSAWRRAGGRPPV